MSETTYFSNIFFSASDYPGLIPEVFFLQSIELITCIASGGDIGKLGKFAGDPLRENS